MISQTRPDFVMVGASVDEGVMLLASMKLSYVELQAEVDEVREWYDRVVRTDVRYTLSTEMREYVTIVAPTYGQAFERLFKTWSPEQGGKSSRELPMFPQYEVTAPGSFELPSGS